MQLGEEAGAAVAAVDRAKGNVYRKKKKTTIITHLEPLCNAGVTPDASSDSAALAALDSIENSSKGSG